MTEVEVVRRFDLSNAVGDRCGLDDELAEQLEAAGAARIIRRVDVVARPRCSEGECPFDASADDGICSEHRRARFAGAGVGRFNVDRRKDEL